MDVSKNYINMCEKAIEIQNDLKIQKLPPTYFKDGDYVACKHKDNTNIDIYKKGLSYFNCVYIWIPRQDQLQEMLNWDDILCIINEFYYFTSLEIFYRYNFNSIEQITLSFFMKKKHNKFWNGEKWLNC